MTAQQANSAVVAPATASGEYQVRKSLSRKVWRVKDRWLRTRG
jgi:hypothetical protein